MVFITTRLSSLAVLSSSLSETAVAVEYCGRRYASDSQRVALLSPISCFGSGIYPLRRG
jgi:hypothetical protein